MIFHALVGDDLSGPVQLTDYGQGGVNRLGLRHELQYRGIMPDLNARRYQNYQLAYRLSVWAGEKCPVLLQRAEQLKSLIMTLWNPKGHCFDLVIENGSYTLTGNGQTVQALCGTATTLI